MSIYRTLKNTIMPVLIVAALIIVCADAQAQSRQMSGFIDEYFHVQAIQDQDGPSVQTRFEYVAFNGLFTSGQAKIKRSSYEDLMAVGITQNFGGVSAKLAYNLYQNCYPECVVQKDDILLDMQINHLRIQHRISDLRQISTLGIPFDLFAVELDLSISKIVEQNAVRDSNVYQFHTKIDQLKVTALWQDKEEDYRKEFLTEYRPTDSWMMKYSHCNEDGELERTLQGEYAINDYRISGEYVQIKSDDNSRKTGAVSVAKKTELASVKLRLSYGQDAGTSSLFLEIVSDDIF